MTNGSKARDGKNFLFISLDNLSGDLAWILTKEGHRVKYCVQNSEDHDVADGFVEKVEDWKAHVEWADVIIFDDSIGQGATAQKLRSKGKKVFGGTPYTDRLEDDRSFGQEELQKAGVSTLPYKDFSSFSEAIAFIKSKKARYVIKPTGDTPPSTRSILFVGREPDGSDVVEVLEGYKQAWEDKIPAIQLQKHVDGVEVAVGAFFNGKRFAYPINVNFEHKRLCNGELGPNTGEMGTSMFWSGPNKIFNQTLKKMEEKLAEEGYIGYIDLNCIVNESGIYPLEFTARFGYPTIFIQQEGIDTPLGEFLYGLADGTLTSFKTKKGFQIGVRLVVPPFPYNDEETFNVKSKGATIHLKGGTDGIHIEDVKTQGGRWTVAGTSGVVLTVCGTGESMEEAQRQAYGRIKDVYIPRMYYRTDIGDRWHGDSEKLRMWGYLA